MTTTERKAVPVRDEQGHAQLFDMYVNGEWIGSRRTLAHCEESFRNHNIRNGVRT